MTTLCFLATLVKQEVARVEYQNKQPHVEARSVGVSTGREMPSKSTCFVVHILVFLTEGTARVYRGDDFRPLLNCLPAW